MVYFEKILLLSLVTYMNDYNEGIQICLILGILFVCQGMEIINKPYYTDKLNALALFSIFLQTLFILFRLMIRTFALHENAKLKSPEEIIGNLSRANLTAELVATRGIKLQEDNSTIILGIVYGFILIFLAGLLRFVS